MVEWNTVFDIVTMGLIGSGGYALYLVKEATNAAVKTTAEEAAKVTIKELQWPMELAKELQRTSLKSKILPINSFSTCLELNSR